MSNLATERTNSLPKYARIAASIRAQIEDGTLSPGASAPSGAAFARITGYSALTCRKALGALLKDGELVPGPSRNARPRIADLHDRQRRGVRSYHLRGRHRHDRSSARYHPSRLSRQPVGGTCGSWETSQDGTPGP